MANAPSSLEWERVVESYVCGVSIVEYGPEGGEERRYRFEAPEHTGISFAEREKATLYADVYFDVNGFQEAGTGERGVPPVLYQAGRDTIAAYLYTRDHVDLEWLGSFFAHRPEKVSRMIENVRTRAASIRRGARERESE